ncbi:plasmid stability protein [Citrobacter werkmanii]|nr:plasmid partitioning/stability family protein [Citrobacter werkmanii]MBQ4938365.1 plasmid stability protein [Citrobacter werkmanii]MBQ4951133.1 plasmid stability protein [Citrobacter werkmanii]
MSEERKKFTLYLHPERDADRQALEVIEAVPRSTRGELFRNAFISGMALQQLDPRLPALLAAMLNKEFTADQLTGLLSQTTGWKPTQADIRSVLQELGVGQFTPAIKPEVVEDDEQQRLEEAREKMKSFL